MPSAPKLPLPVKALSGLGSIASGSFASAIATLVTGGTQALTNADPHVLIGASAFGGLIGLFGWIKSKHDRCKADQVADLLQQNASDSLTALQLIAEICKGNLKVSVRIDEGLKGELESACRRAITAERNGLSRSDAETIVAAIHESATHDQLERLKGNFDDFREVTEMLLWTQDHRGREHDAILTNIQNLVVRVATQCPALIRIEEKLNGIAKQTAQTAIYVRAIAEALERRERESDEQVKARLRPIVEAEVRASLETEFAAQSTDREKTVDTLLASLMRAAHVPGLIAGLRESRDGRQIFEALRQVSTRTDADFIEVHRGIAEWAFLTGEIDETRRSLERILMLIPDDRDALNRMGHVHRIRRNLTEAEECYQRLLGLTIGEPTWQAVAYADLGLIFKARGELDQAEKMHKKALAINEKLGRLEGMTTDYNNLGVVLQTRGDLDQAEVMHKKSLELNEILARQRGMANSCNNLGIIYMTRGDLNRSEAMHRRSLEINEKLGRLEGIADAAGNLGIIHDMRQEFDEAERLYQRVIQIEEELHRPDSLAKALGNLGIVYQKRRQLCEAETMHRESLAINEKHGRPTGIATQYANLGILHKEKGDLVNAREYWTMARDLFAKIGMQRELKQVQGCIDGLPPEGNADAAP